MLTPETAAELDRVAAAKREARKLPEWERRVVARAIAEGATQHEIAQRLGISQVMVSKVLRRQTGTDD